jgi:lambda family phage tail tape measure protein
MPAPALSFPVRANLDDFNKKMSDLGNMAGRATRLAVKSFENMDNAIVASSATSFRKIALGVGGAVVAAKLFGAAISATREQLAELLAIADKAADRNVGADFFQGFVSESRKLRVAVSDMEDALSHASQATKEKSPINLSEWETAGERITEVEKALRVFNATGGKLQGLVLYRDAETQEDKIMAVLTAMNELEAQGRKLEALQLGELMFGSKFVDNIRLGKTSVDSILQSMQAAKEAGDGVFSQAMIERAKQVDDQLRLAHQRLDKEMKPSWQSLASIMLDIKEAWTWVVDKAAAFARWINRVDLKILKDELADINKALEEGPANRSGFYILWSDRMLTERRDALQGMIDDRSGPVTRPMVTVNRPSRGEGDAPTRKESDASTSRDRFESTADSIEKRTAALNAETAAIDLGTAARERAKIVAELETVAKQANTAAGMENTEVTDEQRERINAVADAWSRAAAASEQARGPFASAARSAMDFNKNLQNIAVSSVDNLTNAFLSIADGSKTAKEAIADLAQSALRDLSQMIIKAMLYRAISSMFGVPGFADGGFVPGFASGGYTGGGGKYQPAGIVHRGEYVFNQEAVNRIGVRNLDRLHGYAQGGLVAPAKPPASASNVTGTPRLNSTLAASALMLVARSKEQAKKSPTQCAHLSIARYSGARLSRRSARLVRTGCSRMTCIALVIDRKNCIYIASDGIGYDDDGIAVAIHPKVLTLPHLSAAIASTGCGHFTEAFYSRFGWKLESFDDLVEHAAEWSKIIYGEYVAHYGVEDSLCFIMAGWSDARERFEAHSVSSYEGSEKAAPWTLSPLPYIWSSVGLGANGDLASRFGLRWPELDSPGPVNGFGMTTRLVCAARARSGPLPDDIHDSARAFAVGGFLQLTVVERDHVSTAILHRWPDEIGKKVDPLAGEPMPVNLPEANAASEKSSND